MSEQSNNKRIAQNTIILYLRMIVVMLIALYTSRVVLNALGVSDYGLYDAVGGVVGLFTFFRSSMEKATQRFINVEMEKSDGSVSKIFSVSFTIQLFISILVVLLAETFGLWFLNEFINIPPGREYAANIIYQTVVLSLFLTIISIPYSASIIAFEKMGIYAVVSIIDAVLKLLIALLIALSGGDRLIIYSCLLSVVSIINFIIYYLYCRKRLKETVFRMVYDRCPYKEIFSFIGWSFIGQAAIIGSNQANNVLVNIFHGVKTNAALSIGTQVNSAIVNLSANFQTAFNPQITKSYASNDYDYLKFLLYTTSKFSFFLLFVVSLPIIMNIDFILKLWLGTVPQYASEFCVLCIIVAVINALSTPLHFCVLASGQIKSLQIVSSIIYLIWIAVVFILFGLGSSPTTSLITKVVIITIILFVRLFYTTKYISNINFYAYIQEVILPLLLVCLLTIGIAYFTISIIHTNYSQLYSTVITAFVSIILSFYIGMSNNEREMTLSVIKKTLNKFNR